MSRSLHQPNRILRAYIEALTGFSLVYSSDGLNNTDSLKAASLKQLLVKNVHFRDRGAGKEPPIAQVRLEDQPAVGLTSPAPFPQHTVP